MKGITFYKEDREPTPDNPNEIICGMVDENAEIYIERLENKLELLQNDLDNSNSKLSDYAGRCLKAIEYIKNMEDFGKVEYDTLLEILGDKE